MDYDTSDNENKFFVGKAEDLQRKGLNEDIIRQISTKNNEPQFLIDWRLRAYRQWIKMEEPKWHKLHFSSINYQDIDYISKLDTEVNEDSGHKRIIQQKLAEAGIVLCSMAEAIQKYPDLVQQYLGSVVPYNDNFFATLNSAVFSSGMFCYIPKGVQCPFELSRDIQIRTNGSGSFERTLLIAEKGSSVKFNEGHRTPLPHSKRMLHTAVVELIAMDNAEIKYSNLQNWSVDDKEGHGGVFNLETKRGKCKGNKSRIVWVQMELGAAINWKYPSVILAGDDSVGEFYSVVITKDHQETDAGSKMIHIGKNTKSTILAKGISAGYGQNSYRSLVSIQRSAINAINKSHYDFLLLGQHCAANVFPTLEMKNRTSLVEHESYTSKIDDNQLFYFRTRGIKTEEAVLMILKGFCEVVLNRLPTELAASSRKLLENTFGGDFM